MLLAMPTLEGTDGRVDFDVSWRMASRRDLTEIMVSQWEFQDLEMELLYKAKFSADMS